jgi:uncharacterized protein (TIGR02452 family)
MGLKGMAEATLAIVDEGRYTAPSGREVDIAEAVEAAVEGTRLYRPHELARAARVCGPRPGDAEHATAVEVTTESTSEAGQRLIAEGAGEVAVLNFASARNVGGGFLGGARAQEEELCRASALYRCLETAPEYYEANRTHRDSLYTDHAIWSPRVPFFRDRSRTLLEAPFALSVITAPAPNARAVLERDPGAEPAIRTAFERRAAMVLAIARDQGQHTLVLGAWGCGAFGGDPEIAAGAFDQALRGPFAGVFRRVVFAILVARGSDTRNYEVFAARFGRT